MNRNVPMAILNGDSPSMNPARLLKSILSKLRQDEYEARHTLLFHKTVSLAQEIGRRWASLSDREKYFFLGNLSRKEIVVLEEAIDPEVWKKERIDIREALNSTRDKADIVIITAVSLEEDAILRRLMSPRRIATKHRVYHYAELPTEDGDKYSVALLSLRGMGNVNAAVATTQAIDVWNPQAVFVVGIAGGVKADLEDGSLGDVVVAEQIVAYEPGKIKNRIVSRRYDVLRPAHNLLVAAREFARRPWTSKIQVPPPDGRRERQPKVHFGVTLSGEKVIADNELVNDLRRDWPKMISIDMEGFGAAMASYQAENLPAMLQIRGISDWADSTKNDDWQAYAADVAASFALAFLESRPFSMEPQRSQPQRSESVYFSGKHKIRLCQRLGNDWHHLADYYEIPSHERRMFTAGMECQAIWQWLEDREKINSLPQALDFISRTDLMDILRKPL